MKLQCISSIFVANNSHIMQLIPPQANHYLPLLSLAPLALADSPPLHLFAFALLLLIRPSSTESYCNAIISVLLSALLILDNLYVASCVIFEYSRNSFVQMQGEVLLDWKVWVYMFEAAFLILWAQYSYRKYKQLKAQSMLL